MTINPQPILIANLVKPRGGYVYICEELCDFEHLKTLIALIMAVLNDHHLI